MTCKCKHYNLVNVLHMIKPLLSFIPDVVQPDRPSTFYERFIWTSFAILIYMIASQVPLFGIISNDKADPFYWMRMMMASNRGTLMDLGISPVVTASMIMQFFTMSEIIKVDFSIKEDKILHGAATRLISIIMTAGQAIVQVYTGFYGQPKELGTVYCLLLIVQLIFSGLIIILLDELLQKGYGLGNGVNLFVAANVCENIIWKAFSPKVFFTGRGIEFEGSVIAFFHLLFVRKNKFEALYEIFFRQNLPNMFSFVSTILIFVLVIYLQQLKIELTTESTQVRGQTSKYPIKLLYTSTTPIYMQNLFVSHFCTISRLLFKWYPNSKIVKLIGTWSSEGTGRMHPIKGLAYLVFPPENIFEAFKRPFYFMLYLIIMFVSAAILCRAWIDVSDLSPAQAAKQLKRNNMTLKGHRGLKTEETMRKYIPTAALLGGLCTSLVVLLSNLLDTIGSGTNIFLATSIVYQYMELFAKETARLNGLHFIE